MFNILRTAVRKATEEKDDFVNKLKEAFKIVGLRSMNSGVSAKRLE